MKRLAFLLMSCVFASLTWAESDECVRADPVAAFSDKLNLDNYSFKRVAPHEAVESFNLPTGTSVVVTHSGCAHFGLSFAFSVEEDGHSIDDSSFWLARAKSLMNELGAIETSSIVAATVKAIDKASLRERYSYGDQIETIDGYEYSYIDVKKVEHKVIVVVAYGVIL